jgi:hypothetical protein
VAQEKTIHCIVLLLPHSSSCWLLRSPTSSPGLSSAGVPFFPPLFLAMSSGGDSAWETKPGGPRAAGLANGIKFQLCYCNAVQQVFRQQELVEPQHVPWPSCHLGILAPTLQTFSRTPGIQELLSLLRLRPVAECTKCCWSLGHMIVVHPELRTLTNAQLLLLAKVLQNGNRICGFAPGRQQDSYQYLNHLLDEEWDLDVGPPRARARAQAKAGKATGKGNEQRPPWCYSSAVRCKFARVGGTSMTCTECAVPRAVKEERGNVLRLSSEE